MRPISLPYTTYQHRSLPYVSQRLVNVYAELAEGVQGKTSHILLSCPGTTSFSSPASGEGRGVIEWKGSLYAVTGSTLYSVNSSGVTTSIGTIGGAGMCSFARGKTYLTIQSSAGRWNYDGTTLTQVTDSDFVGGRTVTYLDGYVIGDRTDGDGRWGWSDVDDPTAYTAASFITAESDPDNALAVVAINRRLLVFGEYTVEPYYNAGTSASAPFERINQTIFEIGTDAPFSVATLSDKVFFLGQDRKGGRGVYQLSVGAPQQISTPAINKILEGADTSGAVGFCYSQETHDFYVLRLPEHNRTIVFDATFGEAGAWHERQSGVEPIGAWDYHAHAFAYSKHIVQHADSGALYALSLDVFQDVGEEMAAEITLPPIGQGTARNHIDRVFLDIESGIGANQRAMLTMSDDGARTFGREFVADAGPAGEFRKRLMFRPSPRQFNSRVLKFRHTDNAPFRVLGCYAQGSVGLDVV